MVDYTHSKKRFSYKQGYSKKIPSGAVDIQLVRMPWNALVAKPGYLTYLAVSNPVGSAGKLDIWDQDASSTTPPTAGSAGAALYPLEIAASAASGVGYKTTVYTDLAQIPINGGLNAQSSLPGVTVMWEVSYI